MARTRGVGLFRLLSAPIRCHVDACSYECGLDMPECYPSWLIHGHVNLSTAASARRFEVAAVCVPGITIVSSWVPDVLAAVDPFFSFSFLHINSKSHLGGILTHGPTFNIQKV